MNDQKPSENPQRERLRLAAPTQPLIWKEVFASVPKDDWPYSDARDEYVRSPYLLSVQTLLRRWDGIESPEKIYMLLASPTVKEARRIKQAELHAGQAASALTAGELQQLNARRRGQVGDEIERIFGDLEQNETVQVEHIFKEDGKMETVLVHKPLTVGEKSRLRRDAGTLIVTERLLNGEATEIFKVDHSGEELNMEALVSAELKKNPRLAHLYAIANGEIIEGEEVLPPQLPEHQEVKNADS